MGLCCLFASLPSWYTIKIVLLVNALFGLALFLQAWKRSEKIRAIDRERDERFHSSTRIDAQRWSFWRMLPFAITIMPIRVILFYFAFFIPGFFVT